MQKTKSADRWIEGVYQIYFCWEHYYQFALIGSFVLLTYLSLTAPRNLLQRLLVYLNFTLDSEDLFGCNKQKNWFLWAMTARQAAENNRDLSESWPESPLVMKSFFGHESFVVTLDVSFIAKCMPIKYIVATFEKHIRVFLQQFFFYGKGWMY